MSHSHAEKGLKRECSRVKKVFQCTRTMGVSVPSLHKVYRVSDINSFRDAMQPRAKALGNIPDPIVSYDMKLPGRAF